MSLEARICRMEEMEGKPNPNRQYRFCKLAAGEDDEAAIRQDIIAQGYDPDKDLFLIRLVPLERTETFQ